MKINLDSPEIHVADIFEAVAIADQLKATGRCDIFRGQIEQFALQPSVLRPNVDQTLAIERLSSFANWVNSVHELKSLHGKYDQIMAVAQHYGLKTSYLDFTREPKIAGFFATHGLVRKPNERKTGCIVCANQKICEESWADLNSKHLAKNKPPLTSIIDIEIFNLWRIESQQGLFLDIHVDPSLLEMFSFFRHIIFPHTDKVYDLVGEDLIYPLKKSHLENILDEYFSYEERAEGLKRAEAFFGNVVKVKEPDFSRSFIANKLPGYHPSWQLENLDGWLVEPNEKLKNIYSDVSINITISEQAEIKTLATDLKNQILQTITGANYRQSSITWNIVSENGELFKIDNENVDLLEDGSYEQIECGAIVSRLWDGLRRLPYTNEQVAECLTNFIVVARHDYESIKHLYGEHTGVEFSTNISISRSSVSNESLIKSVRADFYDLLSSAERKNLESSTDKAFTMLQILIHPKRLFDFSSFADLFVRQVIPLQPFFSSHDSIIFSPARLEVFGLS